jgi:beta-mannosidase
MSRQPSWVLRLDRGWSFRCEPPGEVPIPAPDRWREARVPGHVHTDLLHHGLIPDPYRGAPEAGLQWIGLAGWVYRCEFDVPAAALAHQRIELALDGLDTFADVWLNGQHLLYADNAFRSWRLAPGGALKPGVNELRVHFDSPIRRLASLAQSIVPHLPGNYSSPFGDESREAMTCNFARKPGYHYGWDWGPRYVTCGVWRPVRLEAWSEVRLVDLHVQTHELSASRARLAVRLQCEGTAAAAVTRRLVLRDPDGAIAWQTEDSVALQAGVNSWSLPVELPDPQPWWPAGHGAPALYTLHAELGTETGISTAITRRVGLRTVELRRDEHEGGQSFGFVVNGVDIFAKGANAIPFDMFPNRVPESRMRQTLLDACAAHFNMLRLWGGGYYESDAFYEMADELGLMIWQDFMFGGGVVPAHLDDFRANAVAEAREQVRRLRHHPSIVLWCGNNEEETAWKDWGYRQRVSDTDPALAERVWRGYEQLFGLELREVVRRDGLGVPYWSSSPSNDLDAKANDSTRGDKHYWEVWGNPAYPVETYLEVTPRFMSEYGLQAWPVQATVDSVIPREQQQIDGPVVRAHQKFLAGDGNQRLLHYIRAGYREPADFGDFLYLSQVMQAEGIALAARHHRASRPYTMGTLYWQLNDVWPGASWSSIDHLGRWKALHFHARRFFAPLAVVASRAAGLTRISVVNDLAHEVRGPLRLELMGFDGKLIDSRFIDASAPPASARELLRLSDEELLQGRPAEQAFAVLQWQPFGLASVRTELYFAPAMRQELPDPGLRAAVREDAAGPWLELRAERLARAVWLEFEGHEVVFEDNAFDLLPGEARVIRLQGRAPAAALRVRTLDRPGAYALPTLEATR